MEGKEEKDEEEEEVGEGEEKAEEEEEGYYKLGNPFWNTLYYNCM